MNTNSVRWRAVPRDALPELLFAQKYESPLESSSTQSFNLTDNNVLVGYAEARLDNHYNPPCALVIHEDSAAETLSWLRVYAPETFPLSQYARIVGSGDWQKFSPVTHHAINTREDIWASVVLGEVLGQGESDAELASIPLSRAGACFSMPLARASCTYGTDEATRTCADRLRNAEADRRFVRRSVSIDDLIPVWALAAGDIGEPVSPVDTVEMVLRAAEKYWSKASDGLFSTRGSLSDLPGFSSDSIEERVVAFRRLSTEMLNSDPRASRDPYSEVLLAAAAFLVGRSTSHEFLLRRMIRQYPVACVWYGLIAALAGPTAWDQSWAIASKGIERQIRGGFDWSQAPGFDLCWLEYSWMSSAFEGQDAFMSLPKLMPRVLSIEIVPGSTCQFRLMTSGSISRDNDVRQPNSYRERELQAALSQFVALANRTRGLVEGAPPVFGRQQSLPSDGEESAEAKQKARRVKNPPKS